jgi:uncharacterized protein YqfB (UPF0267 family)
MRMELICKCGAVIPEMNIEVIYKSNEEGEEYCEIEAICTVCRTDYTGLSEWGHCEGMSLDEIKDMMSDYYDELTIKEPAV